jgi:spoIIIJ-associated protein
MTEANGENGIRWLSTLLQLQGLSATVSGDFVPDEAGEGSYWLTIDDASLTPTQIEGLLGERGTVLDSIQYLANTVLNLGQSPEAQQAYTVELAGYRRRRQAELQAMADHAAEQAQATGAEFELCDLSSAERRQVHNFLKGYAELETFSRGKEPDRRLVVRPLEAPLEDQ